jgi:hypothetical protein
MEKVTRREKEIVTTVATVAHTGGYKRMDKVFYCVTCPLECMNE